MRQGTIGISVRSLRERRSAVAGKVGRSGIPVTVEGGSWPYFRRLQAGWDIRYCGSP